MLRQRLAAAVFGWRSDLLAGAAILCAPCRGNATLSRIRKASW